MLGPPRYPHQVFRKVRRAKTAAAVAFDPWCGDAEAPQLRSALEAGDTGRFAASYGAGDPQRREFLVERIVLDAPTLPVFDTWPEIEPGSALAFLGRGVQRIAAAWEARGAGYAETVGERAWDFFFEALREAEADLHRSIELEDDGVAWSFLITSGMGLQLSVEELRDRYSRATGAGQVMPSAADRFLQALCAKWLGSHEEMFAFARETSTTSPEGDPRHRLVAIAHFERGVDFREDAQGRDRYRADAAAQAEIIRAAERSVFSPDFGVTPQHRITLNAFALALGYFQRADVAALLFEGIGDAPTSAPWDAFGDPRAVFLRFRQESAQASTSR
jgi:hypothetical protein